jgi:hypothetical protein
MNSKQKNTKKNNDKSVKSIGSAKSINSRIL